MKHGKAHLSVDGWGEAAAKEKVPDGSFKEAVAYVSSLQFIGMGCPGVFLLGSCLAAAPILHVHHFEGFLGLVKQWMVTQPKVCKNNGDQGGSKASLTTTQLLPLLFRSSNEDAEVASLLSYLLASAAAYTDALAALAAAPTPSAHKDQSGGSYLKVGVCKVL